jgi:hypothetical protein
MVDVRGQRVVDLTALDTFFEDDSLQNNRMTSDAKPIAPCQLNNIQSEHSCSRHRDEDLDALKLQMEIFSQENSDLRKKVDDLHTNKSLVSQMHKLQANVTNANFNTRITMLVLCLAVMLGSWSPLSQSMCYSSSTYSLARLSCSQVSSLSPFFTASTSSQQAYTAQAGSRCEDTAQAGSRCEDTAQAGFRCEDTAQAGSRCEDTVPVSRPYAMPLMPSRVPLSHQENDVVQEDQESGPHVPFSYNEVPCGPFSGCPALYDHEVPTEQLHQSTPKPKTMDVEMESWHIRCGINVAGDSTLTVNSIPASSKPDKQQQTRRISKVSCPKRRGHTSRASSGDTTTSLQPPRPCCNHHDPAATTTTPLQRCNHHDPAATLQPPRPRRNHHSLGPGPERIDRTVTI